jgi:hypothetical protein
VQRLFKDANLKRLDVSVTDDLGQVRSRLVSQIVAADVEDANRGIQVEEVGNHLQAVIPNQIAIKIQFHELRSIAQEFRQSVRGRNTKVLVA